MKEITIFVADDGMEFQTPEEALARDALLARGGEIDEWISNRGHGEKKAIEYKRVILDFMGWGKKAEA